MGAFTKLFSRLRITSDPNVSTQTSAVITADSGNTNLVIAPSGTGAIVASIPNGTPTGGNARGQYAVDLKPGGRTDQTQVASGNYSAVLGGNVSMASGNFSIAGGSAFATGTNSVALGGSSTASGSGSVAIGGEQGGGLGCTASGRAAIAFGMANQASADWSNSLGGINNVASSQYSTILGGSGNTASASTHATVVGGQGNVSSGPYSISGGQNCTSLGLGSVAFGINSTAASYSMAAGYFANAGGSHCFAFGQSATASGGQCFATGTGVQASGTSSVAMGYYTYSSGEAAVSLGTNNRATGKASIAVGNNAAASLLGQFSVSSGAGIYNGGNVYSIMAIPLATAAVNSGGTYTFTLENGQLILPENQNGDNTVPYQMLITAKVVIGVRAKSASITTIGDNDIFMSTYNLGVRRRMGFARTIIGAPQQVNTFSDASLSTTTVNFAIGASNELLVSFTPPTWTGGGQIVFVATLSLEMTMMGMHQAPI